MFINEDIHPRIREWFYNQMTYWLRYVLNTTDCDGAVNQSFDEMLEEMYRNYVYRSTHDIYDSTLQIKFTAPACNCLWDILFNKLGDGLYNYKPILSAYRTKYEFTTKEQIYHHMINKLDAWIDTVNDRNDIITIALGMTLNINIFDAFYRYNLLKTYNNWYTRKNFYDNILNALDKINFDATHRSIDYWYYIEGIRFSRNVEPYTPYVQQVDDLQSVYSSNITAVCRYLLHIMKYDSYSNNDSDDDYSDCDSNDDFNADFEDDYYDDYYDDYDDDSDPFTIQYCIKLLTNTVFRCSSHRVKHYLKQYGLINNITDKWQILDHITAAIGTYPKKLEPILELCRTHRFKFYGLERYYYKNFSSMTELIDFDTIPIALISPILTIEDIPEYCAKLSKTYTGSRTKAAKHEDIY